MSGLLLDPRYDWCFYDDFFGGGTLGAAAAQVPWVITDTSSAGTPTYSYQDLGESSVAGALGSISLAFDSQNEVQNVCLSFGDKLAFDINKVRGFEARVKMGQATADTATQFAIGLTGDRNDTIDTIAIQSLFRVIGGDSTTALVVESDDGTTDRNDIATGTTLVNAWKTLRIDLSAALIATYFVDGVAVATGTSFDMSAYDAGLQPFVQLQKSADTTTDSVQIDYIKVWGVR